MKFINFIIVKFSILLVLGILVAHYFPISFFTLKILPILLLVLGVFWFIARKQLLQQFYFGIIAYLCFFTVGYVVYQISLPEFKPNHFSNIVKDETPQFVEIKILQSLKSDSYNHKYFAKVRRVNGHSTSGKILFNVSKDSVAIMYRPDEVLLVYAPLFKISSPINPEQFDFSKYMEFLGVRGQMRVSGQEVLKVHKGKQTIFGNAQNLRSEIVEKLGQSKLKTEERAIVQALVLGEKKDIDKNLYDEYAAAGAVHILAVSGLHVGIFYVLLSFFFKPIKRLRYGIVLHTVLIVLLLWAFAMLSGLSPSVTRAVTMFSFFALAQLTNRRTNSINTLFLSLLLLLTINPLWLFQVGFQLSYLAVFFIVWLQPILYSMGYSKYWFLRKAWGIVSVTLCAQIGVLPLSLYYFHQFPGLFLLTNLIILPFLTILMFGGILIVLLAALNSLPDWLSEIYNSMIGWLNRFIHWIAMQENFIFKEIHFSTLKVISAYLLIFALAFFVRKRKYETLMVTLVFTAFFLGIYIFEEIKTSSSHVVVFHKRGKTLIGHKEGRKLKVFHNDSTDNFLDSNPIKSYRTALNIKKYSEKRLPNIFRYNQKNILVLDSLGIFPEKGPIDIVILTQSPKVNLNRMIDSLHPKRIVADGSNYFSYTERWKKTCQSKKLPFHYTGKQGAFTIN